MRLLYKPLLRVLSTVVGVVILTYFVMASIPGNPIFSKYDKGISQEELNIKLKSEKISVFNVQQFLSYGKKLLLFDFGKSKITGENINDEIAIRVYNTFQLTVFAVIIFLSLGLGLGLLGALFSGSFLDQLFKLITAMFMSTPVFWFGLVLMIVFSLQLSILPASGSDTFVHLILPAFTIGLRPAAFLQRLVQSRIEEALQSPFVQVAMSKGLSPNYVLIHHALRNALIPIVTIIALEFSQLMTGAVVAETIFSYKGIGTYILQGINSRDYNIILATVYVTCLFVIFINLILDLTYSWIDPRLKEEN
ncbi:MAG: ABC transporter permease [Candidatus Cloacimonetes bacterium]|nr:ABC transporter permease [Candidatus Cloacimonadota bacterium]